MNKVAVRIIRKGNTYWVIGRKTKEAHTSFEAARTARVE
jgi:hypothetical protein